MNLFDRYRFANSLDARAASERIKLGGVPVEALQLMRNELIVSRSLVMSGRTVEEAVRLYRGELVELSEDLASAEPTGTAQENLFFTFRFPSPREIAEAKSAIIRVTGCGAESYLTIGVDNSLTIPAGHYMHDRPVPGCRLEGGSHTAKWRDVVAAIEAGGGKTQGGFEAWERGKREDQGRFISIEEEVRAESRKFREILDTSKASLWRYPGPREMGRAVDALIRAGVSATSISTRLSPTLVVIPSEIPNWDEAYQLLIGGGGKPTTGGDVLGEWVDRGIDGKIELNFSSGFLAAQFVGKLVSTGWAKETLEIRDTSVLIPKTEASRVVALADEIKSAQADIITKVGRLRP